jgi:hypothetical protein
LKKAKDIVPIHRINRIRAYKIPLTKDERQYASLSLPCGRKKYNINIRLSSNNYIENSQGDICEAQILENLAHELAHLIYFDDHGYKHFLLQAKILLKFAQEAKRRNIKDLYKGLI